MFPVYANSFSEIFTGLQPIIYVVLSLGNTALLFFASLKFILVMQQGGYKGRKFFKWLSSSDTPYLSRLMLLCLLGFLFFCVLNICFTPVFAVILNGDGGTFSSYVGFFSYILFTAVYIRTESAVNAKIPLRKTKRLVRLSITFLILLFVFSFAFIVLFNFLAFIIKDQVVAILRYSLFCGMPILSPYILFLAYGINEPFEHAIKKRYIRKTKERLNELNVIKIGITGSFGKTSVKEILRTILSQKYRVLSTPKSYNTPSGISLTVKKLDNTYDIFIAEMGARSKGDIKELCDIVRPEYGVLTGINNQHLETFGSIENTKNTKYELFESLPESGAGFFSLDNEISVELYNKFGGQKYSSGINGRDKTVYASDITMSERGTEFTLNVQGEKPIKCSTVLLGKHSISNICLASAVAHKIGMSAEEIAEGINRIQSVGHRLELVPNNKGIVIIDDSYNSNEDGVSSAMEVLSIFKGRKIVVTPGLVELGKEESVANANFGKTLAKYADIVIIVGKHNAEMIIHGLLDGGMNRENIKFAKNLNRGNDELNKILKTGDVVLFENDLPDNYN